MVNKKQYLRGKNDLMETLNFKENLNHQQVGSNPNDFHQIIDALVKSGWKRIDIYTLLWDIMNNHYNELDELVVDELGEFETSITGYCSPESIFKFPDDPENIEQLTAVVRAGKWKL